MMAKIPGEIDKKDESKQILRVGIIAELDAVNLYEQLVTKAKDKRIKKVLLDIAKEEKTHVGEFLALLTELDKQQKEELEKGKEEVEELTS
jgi:rubrerythrin